MIAGHLFLLNKKVEAAMSWIMTKIKETAAISGPHVPDQEKILTKPALRFLEAICEKFEPERQRLLEEREVAQAAFNKGAMPSFLKKTEAIRKDSSWKVGPIPKDLERRWVEITGPVERKMMINALNSGADVFMADFEDSLSPTWENVIAGQLNLIDAVNKKISYQNPDGKEYLLKDNIATLMVRPRGFHLIEKHCTLHGKPVSASFFDFALYLFHNAAALNQQGTGPYFYLPKMESHEEAKLWDDVFVFAQELLSIPRGTIKATVLIETLPAAFEMEEILYVLKDHIVGLNAGRWDYIFSIIKKFARQDFFNFPDRSQITMTTEFMKAYTKLLIQTCRKRGAYAMGGMAAFIPSRKDPKINEVALKKVQEDKLRETKEGFNGTWVAHPDLVSVAREVFQNAEKQTHKAVDVKAQELLQFTIHDGAITEAGVRSNIAIALHYMESWLSGQGAVAINNLMEDAATAEISRSQLWQWIHHGAVMEGETLISKELFEKYLLEEMVKKQPSEILNEAARILSHVVKSENFENFFTTIAYESLP